MKIRAKLLLGFIAAALLCGVVGILGIVQMTGMQGTLKNLSVNSIPTIVAINDVQTQLYAIDAAVRSLANPSAFADDAYIEKEKKDLADARASRDAAIKAWEATTNTPEEQRLWDAFKSTLPGAAAYNDSIVALVDKARKLPAAAASPAVGRAAAVAPSSDRDALIAQLFELVSGDKRAAFDDMVAKAQKVADYDQQYYGQDLPKAAIASASASIVILVICTIISFGAALLLGLFLGTSLSGSVRKIADRVGKIAAGDLSQKLENRSKDELGELALSVNTCIDNISSLVVDAGMLEKAAIEGKLATRADASRHQGDYKKIVDGVNKTLDSVIGPLNVAANYVDRISKGDLPPKITDSYNGDFNVIKNNLNVAIDSINALVTDAGMLVQAAIEGKLATRADATKHQGDYRKIVDGVNKTLDAVIGPLNVTARYVDDISKGVIPPIITDSYNGDFNIIKSNLNTVVKMMSDLLKETDVIIKAAADGELDKRANANLFLGGWNQLVTGINSTITNIVDPLMVTADYVDKVAKGVIPPEITTVYNGQYNLIKTNLNAVVKMMSDLLKETDVIIRAAADGELDKRAEAGKFLGGWNQLVTESTTRSPPSSIP